MRQYTKSLRRCLVRHADHIHHVLPSSSASGQHFDSALHDLVALSHTNPSPGEEGGVGGGADNRAGAGAAGGGGSGARGAEGQGKAGPVSWRAFQRMIVAQSRNLLGRPASAATERRRASEATTEAQAGVAAGEGGSAAAQTRAARPASAPNRGGAGGPAALGSQAGKES